MNLNNILKLGINILTLLLIVTYPFVVFLGLKHWTINTIAPILIIIFCIRFIFTKNKISTLAWFSRSITVFIIALVFLSWLFKKNEWLLFYPVAVNTLMLLFFGYSLLSPPSIIERLARLQEPNLPEKGVRYTKTVTQVWCLFFIINGSIALWTCLNKNIEVWTLYNGVISYILMGVLFLGEWIIRKKVQANDSL